ncbi:MAG TPA: SEC-C metal-binding domain-containing protein, partial [Longimicrobiales bacterium]
LPDVVYKTEAAKFRAVVREIEERHKTGQPILVGTISIEKSERLSEMLKRAGIRHQVLNAKYHEKEAEVIAQAGRLGAVTIATNMAGRGTDILLGGNPEFLARQELRRAGYEPEAIAAAVEDVPTEDEQILAARALYRESVARHKEMTDEERKAVIEAGGLHIIGTERHESRRIDNQLRGRSGRQGDPGSSRFYISLEDDLMRLFGSDNIRGIMDRLGVEEDEPIEHPLVTKAIENAQRKVEARNFDIRKRVLDYDDVMNQQREVIYDLRLFALEGGEDLKGEVWDMIEHALRAIIPEYVDPDAHPEEWDLAGLRNRLVLDYFVVVEELPTENTAEHPFDTPEEVEAAIIGRAREAYKRKLKSFGEHEERLLSFILLSVIDEKWRDHLYDLDHLKASIGFRGWGQKDPLIEYKREAYDMFVDLMTDIRKSVSSYVFRAQLAVPQPQPTLPRRMILTGPTDAPQTRPTSGQPAPERESEGEPTGIAAAIGGGRPIGRAPLVGGRAVGAPDVSRLQTNRGGDGGKPQPAATQEKVGRNDPCPCGSGRKYKKCHGVGVV